MLIRTLIASTILASLLSPSNVSAQANSEWYVDTTNRTGTMVRLDQGGGSRNTQSFMVVFEYAKRCDPVFSMVRFRGSSLGSLVRHDIISPNQIRLTVDGNSHSWHGVRLEYSMATELAMGITREAWESLSRNPRSISFFDGSVNHAVPTTGFSGALRRALDSCLQRLK
jgi:hypothetical protein